MSPILINPTVNTSAVPKIPNVVGIWIHKFINLL